MNAAVKMQSCPGEEVLAAFIDQRLDSASRLEVVQHLAECGECRDMVVAANEYRVEKGVETENVVRGSFGPRVWVPLAAAAVLVGVLFGVPSIREQILPGDPMKELIETANGLPERTTAARLSVEFLYKEHNPKRGVVDDQQLAELLVENAALDATQRAIEEPTPSNLHAAGVGNILMKKRSEAVAILEQAAEKSPQSAAILTDLAAAYIARASDKDRDYERAFDAANKAWTLEKTPAAAWNRALALELAGKDKAAVAAWNEYLALDPASPWSKDVRERHLTLLTEP